MPDYIRPFGPTIYHGKFTEEEVEFLQKIAKDTLQANKRMGKSLVGIMKDHMSAEVKDIQKFLGLLQPHIRNYAKYEWQRRNQLYVFPEQEPDFSNVNFDLGKGPWINYQRAGEFQPCHEHIGEISSVVYIDIPKEIEQEEYTKDTNMNCPGQIEFVYGSGDLGGTGSHKIVPSTGDILLFPSQLKHIAYPFHTEGVTRISMSFNIIKWNVQPKE